MSSKTEKIELAVAILAVLVSVGASLWTGVQTRESLELTRRQLYLSEVPQISVQPKGSTLVVQNSMEDPVFDVRVSMARYLLKRETEKEAWHVADRSSLGSGLVSRETLPGASEFELAEPKRDLPPLGTMTAQSFPLKVVVIRFTRKFDHKHFIYVEPFIDQPGFASIFERQNSLFSGGDQLYDIADQIRRKEQGRYGRVVEEGDSDGGKS